MKMFIPSWIIFVSILANTRVSCNPLTRDESTKFIQDETLGISCNPWDSCQGNKTNIGLKICDCDRSCSVYNTCCSDSEFTIQRESSKHNNLKCLRVNNSPGYEVFMVDSCKNDASFDNLCFSDPEENNDPFLLVPVTSNATGITYKNYFCAVCNEKVESTQLEFWDMQVWSNDILIKNASGPQLMFNETIGAWTVLYERSNDTSAVVPVTLSIQQTSQVSTKHCYSDLVGNCSSNWTDDAVEIKCRDYMAIVTSSQNIRYRNLHCALCNFENLSNFQCGYKFLSFDYSPAFAPYPAKSPAVGFDIPLINLFVLEDKKKRCGKNMVYDKFADKCRCNSRIYAKENGKCVHKI